MEWSGYKCWDVVGTNIRMGWRKRQLHNTETEIHRERRYEERQRFDVIPVN